jgi:hypothetical protein
MRFFEKLSNSLNPELVPGNVEAEMLSRLGVDYKEFSKVDAYRGFTGEWPEWVTSEEAARRKAAQPPLPSVEELLEDSDVAAVIEAAGYLAVAKN